jgi:hypothetical protein
MKFSEIASGISCGTSAWEKPIGSSRFWEARMSRADSVSVQTSHV